MALSGQEGGSPWLIWPILWGRAVKWLNWHQHMKPRDILLRAIIRRTEETTEVSWTWYDPPRNPIFDPYHLNFKNHDQNQGYVGQSWISSSLSRPRPISSILLVSVLSRPEDKYHPRTDLQSHGALVRIHIIWIQSGTRSRLETSFVQPPKDLSPNHPFYRK